MNTIHYNRETGTVIISTVDQIEGYEAIGWSEDTPESTEKCLTGSERTDNIGIVSVYPPK